MGSVKLEWIKVTGLDDEQWYVVRAGKVIIIVSPGRLSLVPTGRILSPGSDNDSDDASVHSEATIPQQQRNNQPQYITTVSNNNAKFPYLKKDEYEVWAMKMEYWITNNDMNIWKVIQNGNSLKRTGRDCDGRVIILPPTTADEHIAVQRESKARTTLLQSIPDDHVADFHYMDDARDIWNAVKARFGGNAESKKMRKSMLKQEFSEFRISEAEGLHKGYDRMQKILSQLNQLKAKPEDEDINLKFLRALPSSWSQVALTLKTKGGLEFLSFDDLYYKLKTLEVDIKGYSTFSSSQSAGPNNSAFVSATSASRKMSYADSPSYSSSTYTVPSNSKTGSQRSGNVIEDVLQSFESARFKRRKSDVTRVFQRGHFTRECRPKGEMTSRDIRHSRIRRLEEGSKIPNGMITVDTLLIGHWYKEVITAGDAGDLLSGCHFEVHNYLLVMAIQFNELPKVLQKNQLTLEDKIRVLSIELENTTNLLKHSERINVIAETAKKDLQTKLDNHLVQTDKWRTSSKNLFRLVDSSMSVRTKVGLGFTNYIGENELGWDDSAFSVFTTNSEEVEGRPHFNRFATTDSMKAVPPPLSGDYTPLSDHTDLDESQMSYGTKSSTSSDSNSVSNDFVLMISGTSLQEVNQICMSEGNLACFRVGMAKASVDESVQWHRRDGMTILFVACCKGKQHKASYKAITAVSSISEPLQLLHMDLFGPTSIRSIDHKYYCLVITDDYSKFCWVFFLEHKDETYPILKDFITLVENQLNKKVKAIRCDNGTEFKNAHIIELCGSKGIKRDYSNARTPQQNGVVRVK
ncbi:ribonuclease H-like domain-containing protein [Tanacetum coccineum]